ncbi:MAG: response regulator transcription factor [Bacteroidetes bacterium]|nr:MAG: response regulator transcription factor [Bacteroidota bacterium]
MSKIRVGVVEDEVIIADHMIQMLQELGYETVGPASSYTEALAMLDREKVDILLLDIVLAGKKDGIDLAREMKHSYPVPFIFLTSHADKDTVERAKEVLPRAYLVKPFNKEELYSSIEVALLHSAEESDNQTKQPSKVVVSDAIFIKDGGQFVKLLFDEVYYLEKDHVYLNLMTKDRKIVVRSNFSDYIEKFPDQFIRIHRSYAVNLNHIESLDATTVKVNGIDLPVSKNFRNELISKLNLG